MQSLRFAKVYIYKAGHYSANRPAYQFGNNESCCNAAYERRTN